MTFTTDEQGFLNAILAAPDDGAPKLVYADWLLEQGQDERAWLIREGYPVRWWRRRYGEWDWEREYRYTGNYKKELAGMPYWNPVNWYDDNSRSSVRIARQSFRPSWRRNLNSVIFRWGFVSELGVDRFHDNVFRLLDTQPVRTVTTTAEAFLGDIKYLGHDVKKGYIKSLRTVRLTTIPASCHASKGQSDYHLSFAGIGRIITIPNNGALIYTQGPVSDSVNICYRLGLVFGHYLTPHGITVELPSLDTPSEAG